jgi:hypothetical protein
MTCLRGFRLAIEHPNTEAQKTAQNEGKRMKNVRMFGSEDMSMVRVRDDWRPGIERRSSLERRQVKCLTADEGHVWMRCYDRLPSVVRLRLAESRFNLCPACVVIDARSASRRSEPSIAVL